MSDLFQHLRVTHLQAVGDCQVVDEPLHLTPHLPATAGYRQDRERIDAAAKYATAHRAVYHADDAGLEIGFELPLQDGEQPELIPILQAPYNRKRCGQLRYGLELAI
jgi:hypothetical protein